MRHLMLFFALCAVFSLPVAAQAAKGYQPPSADEKKQLAQHRTMELATLRGADGVKRAALTLPERDELARLTASQSESVQVLRVLRAGDHWGWYVAVPSLCAIVVVLIILIIIF